MGYDDITEIEGPTADWEMKNRFCIFIIFLTFFIFWVLNSVIYTGELDLTNFIKWDAGHYHAIGTIGYEKFTCDNSTDICGNVGWFPFYPLVIRLMSWLLPSDIGMIFISIVCFLIALLLLHDLIAKEFGEEVGLWTIILLCSFPTSFYFLAGFPYSLYLMLSAAIFTLLKHKKYYPSVLLEAALLITYPSGILIYIPKLQHFARDRRFLPLVLPFSSILIYFLYYKFAFNDFFLYLHFQAKYGHHLSFPLIPLLNISWGPEAIIIIFILLFILIFYSRIPNVYSLYGLSLLLFTPTMGTTECIYRHIIVAFPLFLMAATACRPAWVKWGWVVLSILVGEYYFYLFITNKLV